MDTALIDTQEKYDGIFETYHYSTLVNYTPDPTDHLAGHGWLKRKACSLVVGATGIGKSVLVLQIGIAIAAGLNVLGLIPVKRPRKVLYIQAENDAEILKRYTLAITDHLKPDPKLLEENLVIIHAYGLTGEPLAMWIRNQVAEHKPDLVILDPYQSYIDPTDMNSSGSFLGWIKHVQPILWENNCGLLLVAHSNKSSIRGGTNGENDDSYLAAGSATIANHARTISTLRLVDRDTNTFKFNFAKNPATAGLVDGSGRTRRELFIGYSPDCLNPYWRVLDDYKAVPKGQYTDAIVEYLKLNPKASLTDVAKAVSCNKSTVSRVRKQCGI